MSRVLICDGCLRDASAERQVNQFGPDSPLDYCEECAGPALAFYNAAMESRERHVTAWRDELVKLRAQLAGGLKSVPIPQVVG